MAETLETVKVVREDVPGGYMVINKEDFDPEVHVLHGVAVAAGNDPIADLLKKSVGDIKAALPDMTNGELAMLQEAETEGRGRKGVLDAIDDEIESRG